MGILQESRKLMNNIGIDFKLYLQGKSSQEESNVDIKEKYQTIMNKKEVTCVNFDCSDRGGNLSSYEDGWKIILRNEDIYGRKYDSRNRADMINKSYTVVVDSVDDEKKCIYVSHSKAKNNDRQRLKELLDNATSVIEVPAKVVVVYKNILLMDIGGLGVPGYMQIAEWSSSYTIDLRNQVKKGEVITVGIVGKNKLGNGMTKSFFEKWTEQNPYQCSRKAIMHYDPWENIESRLQAGDIIIVRCEEKADNNYFGSNASFPEVNFYCFYPEVEGIANKKGIVPGKSYKCFVKVIDEKKKILRAKTIGVVDDAHNA